MQELIRSMIGYLRQYAGNRRRAPRYKTPLEAALSVSISLLNVKMRVVSGSSTASAQSLAGYTRDLSETGLGIIIPSIRIGNNYLAHESRTLQIMLVLPQRRIELHVVPARYNLLEEGAGEKGYLLGVQITEISDDDRALYLAYLDTLRK
jgi:hypothetical protein